MADFFAIVLLGVWALARKWSVVILGAVALSYIGFFNLMEPASQTLITDGSVDCYLCDHWYSIGYSDEPF